MKLVKLQNLVAKFLYMFVLRAEIVTIFGSKIVISARDTNIYKICKVIYFSVFYNIS
jgi:hypothetical protein